MNQLSFSWWNLENLFDVENSPNRSDKLQRTIAKELSGWNQAVLDQKLTNLAALINQMNDNSGPDLLGVAEVENKPVLEALRSRLQRPGYQVAHADSKDERGIDVAFIYDSKLLEAGEVFNHFVMKRTATRDIVQVNFTIKQTKRPLVVIGNHWPSRSAGTLESEPYRIIAGETLAYFHHRIGEVLGKDIGVLAMGDFNDAPHNRSLMDYALSTNSLEIINKALTKRYFYNLMWPFLKTGDGTHYYDRPELLDQFMVSKGVASGAAGVKIITDSCRIEKSPEQTKNNKPVRFSRPNQKDYNPQGYSDHFPITLGLQIS